MIRLKNITHNYESFKKNAGLLGTFKDFIRRNKIIINAIKSVDIEIKKGEIIGLIGPNGAGKTTLIKIMSGVLKPTNGEITCDGFIPFEKEIGYFKKIGVVLGQKSQLIWDLPASETLNMISVIYDIDKRVYEKRLSYLVGLLNVGHILHTPVRKLSLGERIKFEIICALIYNPDILFLDEPTIGLDITSQRNIHEFLLKINQEQRTTIILTSHYMKDIESLCNRVLIILDGEIVNDSSIEELKDMLTVEEEYILEFNEIAPSTVTHLIQVDNYTIKVPKDELNDILMQIDPTHIKSLTLNVPSFETIIFDIFNSKKED